DLDIRFYYNSFLFTENAGFGNGWTFKYDVRHQNDTLPGNRIIKWGDGREDKYDSLDNGKYKSPRGFYNKLLQYQPGRFMVIEQDSTRYIFDNPIHRRLTRIEEPNGNFLQLGYTDSLITSVT